MDSTGTFEFNLATPFARKRRTLFSRVARTMSGGLPDNGDLMLSLLSASEYPFASSTSAAGPFEVCLFWNSLTPLFSFDSLETSVFSDSESSMSSQNDQTDETDVEANQVTTAPKQKAEHRGQLRPVH